MEELREAEVADALLDERGTRDELEALHLPEVGLLPRHVDEEQLGHVARPQRFLVLLRDDDMRTAKDSRMAAISFWYSARSSAWVLVFLIRVMNSCSRLIIFFKIFFIK